MGRSSLPSRRSLIRTGALSTTAALSGCLLFGIRDARSRPEQLAVSVYNNTEAAHSFRVRVFEPAEVTAADSASSAVETRPTAEGTRPAVFDGTFYLKAGGQEERATDLTGTEYRVLGAVDGRRELDGEWHWAGCRTDDIAVTFWSSTEGSATHTCSQD